MYSQCNLRRAQGKKRICGTKGGFSWQRWLFDTRGKIELQDTDHEGQTDAESVGDSSSDEGKEDSNITSGDIVWGMLDQWARKHAQLIPQQTTQTYSKVAWWK